MFALSQIWFRISFDSDKQSKWRKGITRFVGKVYNHFFLLKVVLGVASWVLKLPIGRICNRDAYPTPNLCKNTILSISDELAS